MDSFDFHSLDDETREQTLAYLKPNPEPQPLDEGFTSYRAMMGDALEEKDWLEEMQEGLEGEEMAAIPRKPTKKASLQCASQVERVKMLSCTWSGCDQSFPEPELTAHLTGHGKDSARLFHAPSSCVWPGCSSKATFKNLSSYKSHLKNIHVEPLICTVSKCSYKKPFRDQDDLDRHSATSHSEVKSYHCPYNTCDAETKHFARRDKWLKHIQETIHENDAFCPYYHCAVEQAQTSEAFKDRKQISKHFGKSHARNEDESYECALGSCAKATFRSYWSRIGLEKHLIQDHDLNHVPWRILNSLGDGGVILKKHFDDYTYVIYRDCNICSAMNAPQGTQAGISTAPGYQPFPSSQMHAATKAQIN